MNEFKIELAALLKKHRMAIVARNRKNDNDLNIEVGFKDDYCEIEWCGRFHLTDYDIANKQ